MTKKAKKKSLKTGSKSSDGPRSTTVVCGTNAGNKYEDTPPKEVEEEDDGDENEENKIPTKKITRSIRKHLEKIKQQENHVAYQKENNKRNVYPTDLWFLLANKIQPEQVKAFSLICKDAYNVITTRKFWLELYKRYATDKTVLPCHLKPKAISTNIGLKTRVIRSLYYAYLPFKDRISHFSLTSIPVEKVEHKTCSLYWWQQTVSIKRNTNVWMLYFKLIPHGTRNRKSNIFKVTELMRYNPEEHCSLLRITATSFVIMPDVTGMYLTGLSVNVSRDMKHHRVKLTFHEYRKHGKYTNSQGTHLVVDPVLDVHILPWWDPEYPHPLDN